MATPWMTTDDLISAVKRKISFPISQNTFSEEDIIQFANEEMFIAQVPSVLQYHEEYFVYRVQTPLVSNISRYSIPNRAIGMKLRDLMWSDSSGNYFEMTRINSDDKAFFQRNIGANQAIHKFYLEGNDVVLTPSVVGGPTGALNFFIYLRPNQLVSNSRARIIESFKRTISVPSGNVISGDLLTLVVGYQTPSPTSYNLVAGTSYAIGATPAITATNLAAAITALGITGVTASASGSDVVVTFLDITLQITEDGSLQISSQIGFEFDSELSSIFSVGSKIDLLQTLPGHRTYIFDVVLQAISGSIGYFNYSDLLVYLSTGFGFTPQIINIQVGDYMCLANESIIPQIPPDLHNVLAERTAARILAAIGDQAGLAITNQKIAEMENRQGNLLDQRSEGTPQKITARHSLLRYGKMGVRRRM
jgi:hypothetical protein